MRTPWLRMILTTGCLFVLTSLQAIHTLHPNSESTAHKTDRAPDSPRLQVIRQVQVVDVRQGVILHNQDVWIFNDRILHISTHGKKYADILQSLTSRKRSRNGQHRETLPSADAPVQEIEGKDRYLLPGLSDMHTHLYTQGELCIYLSYGITQVMNMDGQENSHLRWMQKVRQGTLRSPYIYSTGPIMHRNLLPDQADPELKKEKQAGFQAFKVYGRMDSATLAALSVASKKYQMPLTGHIPQPAGVSYSLQQGLHVSHLDELLQSWFLQTIPGKGDTIILDNAKIKPLVDLIRSHKLTVTPTLSSYRHVRLQVAELDSYLKRSDMQLLIPPLYRQRLPDRNPFTRAIKPDQAPVLAAREKFMQQILLQLVQAGVPVLAGTDATDVGPVPGAGLLEELEIYANCGLTPAEILRTTTLNAAAFLGESGQWGTVEAGQRASLLLVNENPLTDIRNLQFLSGLFHQGRYYTAPELAQMRQSGAEHFSRRVRELENVLATDAERCIRNLEEEDPGQMLSAELLKNLAERSDSVYLESQLQRFDQLESGKKLISERALNNLGYTLLGEGKISEALRVFAINIRRHPNSANTYDSMADACWMSGRKEEALHWYKRALEVDPTYPNAKHAMELTGQAP